jgi:hypothetical protein
VALWRRGKDPVKFQLIEGGPNRIEHDQARPGREQVFESVNSGVSGDYPAGDGDNEQGTDGGGAATVCFKVVARHGSLESGW